MVFERLLFALFVGLLALPSFGRASATWIDVFTEGFLARLQPIDDETQAQLDLFPEIKTAIAALGRKSLVLGGVSYSLDVATFIHDKMTADHVVIVAKFHQPGQAEPLGIWISTVYLDSQRTVTADYLKLSPTILGRHTSVGKSWSWLYRTFLSEIHAKSDDLEAGWIGRYLWALRGYRFQEGQFVQENGVSITQVELMRRNFRRFCRQHEISLLDLQVNGAPVAADLINLNEPIDFVRVKDVRGRKLLTEAYFDHNTLRKPKWLDVGAAFALSDYRASAHQENAVMVGGLPRSDTAMPVWYGVRSHCESWLESP